MQELAKRPGSATIIPKPRVVSIDALDYLEK